MSCFTTMVSWWTTRGSLNNPKPPQFSPSASPKRESQAMRSKANSSSSSSPRSYASFVRFTRWTLGWKNTWKKRCFFGTKKKTCAKKRGIHKPVDLVGGLAFLLGLLNPGRCASKIFQDNESWKHVLLNFAGFQCSTSGTDETFGTKTIS